MTNELVQNESELVLALKNTVYQDSSIDSIKMVVAYCKQLNLDPMLRTVYLVPMKQKDGSMRDVIMPSIGLYRIRAIRSGDFLGTSEPIFGPSITENLGGVPITYPEWASVTVRRLINGHQAEFTTKELWKECFGQLRDGGANAFWQKRPFAQLAKVCESQSLRKAFPEIMGTINTAEESHIEHEVHGERLTDAQLSVSNATNKLKAKLLKAEPTHDELVSELVGLINAKHIQDTTVKTWLDKANATNIDGLNDEQLNAVISKYKDA